MIKERIWIPQIIAVIMLIIAMNPDTEYGYYTFLRIVCCAVFCYLAIMAHAQKKKEWTWILGITAFIYNPIIKMGMNREIWTVVNVITIGIAIVSIFSIRRNVDEEK